jgi:hypothetical protein
LLNAPSDLVGRLIKGRGITSMQMRIETNVKSAVLTGNRLVLEAVDEFLTHCGNGPTLPGLSPPSRSAGFRLCDM